MREIKFRAWDEGNKIMHNDFQFVKSGNESNDWILFVSDKQPISNYVMWTKNPYFQQQLKLMQFTGLKDKNGKEIYEGDVVKMCWQYDGFTNYDWDMTGEVIYNQQDACFMVMNKTHAMHFESTERDEYFPEETEILGNIYENPELLNVPSEKGE